MLGRETIDKVDDLPLVEVISKYVELKKNGANWKGASPFKEEKTPSFVVSPSKGMWKCFATGIGGTNGIKFLMETKKCSFVEAVKELADAFGIEIVYNNDDTAKKYIAKNQQIKTISEINSLAAEYFADHVNSAPEAQLSRVTQEAIDQFNIGYAPDDWNDLRDFLRAKGMSDQTLLESKVVKEGNGRVYNFYRGRLMWPVYNTRGQIVSFSGRNCFDNDQAKWMNGPDSDAYSKSSELLGLYHAIEAIRKKEFAVIVEGGMDISALFSQGVDNTCAPAGTAFTKEQTKLLKRYTSSATIFADDDDAGLRSVRKTAEALLPEGFSVRVFVAGNGMDPDDFVKSKKWKKNELLDVLKNDSTDVIEWLAERLFKDAEEVVEIDAAANELQNIIACVASPSLRNRYVAKFKKKGIEKTAVEKLVSIGRDDARAKEREANGGYNLPSYLPQEQKDCFNYYRFYADANEKNKKVGYYFEIGGGIQKISNCIIKPIFQVKIGNDENKRIVQLKNDFQEKLVEITNMQFGSLQAFQLLLGLHGPYWFHGTNIHFQKLKQKIMNEFAWANPITTLGWQKKGFFAFADGIAEDRFIEIDSYGLCEYNKENYFLPAFSKVNIDLDDDNDEYESDRYFKYKPGTVDFKKWNKQMNRVHGMNGHWSILFMIACVFRDHIFSSLSYFPHLFMFGQVQTGKSLCARSISSVFLGSQAPFNLSSGTDVGFHRRIARFRNAFVWLDEYSNDIKPVRIQLLKGSFDGTGHERGVLSRDNRTEVTKVNSGLCLSGQWLPTVDDNALFTRIILLTFERKAEDLTQEDIDEYHILRDWQKKGLSHLIIEIIKYRDYFVNNFEDELADVSAELKAELTGLVYKGRILDCYSILVTISKMFTDKLGIHVGYEDTFKMARANILRQSEQVVDSDALGSYWKMIEFLSFDHKISEHHDYIIEERKELSLRGEKNKTETLDLGEKKMVLLLRFTKVHPLYLESHRRQEGSNGVPLQSIKSFMQSSKAFLGNVKNVSFEGQKTSAFAFDYSMIPVRLKTSVPALNNQSEQADIVQEQLDLTSTNSNDDLPF